MIGFDLQTEVARQLAERGLAFSFEIKSSIHDAYGWDIADAIDHLEQGGYADRDHDGRLCLVKRWGAVKFRKPLKMELLALATAEAHDYTGQTCREEWLGFRFGRELVDDLVDAGELRLKPGKRVRSGTLTITPRGRAALFRHRRSLK